MKMEFVFKTTNPLVRFTRIMDSDQRPSISSIFHEVQKTRKYKNRA